MIKSGISQVGGKFRLRKDLLRFTPIHEYFLSLFCGSCIYELNKPRPSHYECFNDGNSEFINYLEVINFYRKEFNDYKEGILGFVSRRIYEDIKDGFIYPRNRIERAVMFQYLIKLGFGSRVQFRGLVPETTSKKEKIAQAKKDFQLKIDKASFKGYNPKTTRPYTNNDMGILTKIRPDVSERLHYVILEELDFEKIYYKFHKGYYLEKGLERECFIYADEPYPTTEKYYGDMFPEDRHFDLIELALESPFNIMISTGKECKLYLDIFGEAKWNIEPVPVKYSTHANTQVEEWEYLIMNYTIKGAEYRKPINKKLPEYPLMKEDHFIDPNMNLMNFIQ